MYFRKVRLQVKDETEREEAFLREAHNDKIKKLRKQLDEQAMVEEEKIRPVVFPWIHLVDNVSDAEYFIHWLLDFQRILQPTL